MSEQTTPEPEQHEAEQPVLTSEDAETERSEPSGRKVPLWVWIVAGVVVLAGAIVGVLAGTGAFTAAPPLPTPPAETVTAAPPTPTVEPVEREGEPTAFSAALPDTVLDLALADFTPSAPFVEVEALELYTAVYSDGGSRSVTVQAAQFQDVDAAIAALPAIAEGVEPMEVTAGGVVVGESYEVQAGGQPSILWRNSTALFMITGADEVLVRDVFAVFPL